MRNKSGLRIAASMIRFIWIGCILMATLLCGLRVGAVAPPNGVAPVLIPVGGFGIDGEVVAGSAGVTAGDWMAGPGGAGVLDAKGVPLNPATTFHFVDLYNSSSDNTFGGGLKWTDNPNSWTWSLGKASAKTDINNVLLHISTDASNHSWLVIAADRLSTSGDSYIDFEFLQNTLTTNATGFSSAGPNGGRTINDLLLSLDFASGGSVPDFTAWRWQTNNGTGGFTYFDATASLPTNGIYGAVSGTNTSVPFGAFGATTYAANQFVEAAVDLTALVGNFDKCLSIGVATIMVKTKTSTSSTATIVDFLSPIQYTFKIGPSAYAGPNQTNCTQGAATAFSLQGLATQGLQPIASTTWSVVSGSATIDSASSLSTTAHVSSSSATLRLTVIQSNGCTETSDVVLTVVPTPPCSIAGAASVCPSSSSQFFAPAGLSAYSWTIGGNGTISGPTNAQMVTVTAGSSCSAIFTLGLNVNNNNNCPNSCSTDVMVNNTGGPTVSAPANITITCTASLDPTVNTALGVAAATDGCSGTTKPTYSDAVVPGSCPANYTVQRTWSATDSCGNVATAVQTITVQDTAAPVLAGVPGNLTVECSAVPIPATPTATDNCDPNPKIAFSQTSTQNADATQLGHYSYTITRTWTATDACGNQSSQSQIITVHDTTAPSLSGQGSAQTIQCPASPTFTAPTATDNCDPNPQISFTDTTTPGACAGAYTVTRTWTARDVSGNVSLPVSQTITVQDTTAPVLAGVPANATVECSAVPPPATPTATDNCDSTPKITFGQTSTQNADATQLGHYSYTITRTWTATDACGNQSRQSQVITVQDTTAPVLSGQGSAQTIQCPASPVFTAPTATDNCDPNPKISFVDTTTPGACAGAYTVTRTWTAKDVSGNVSLPVSQTITMEDITPPSLSGVPANVTVECSAVPPAATPTASDNCDPNPKITFAQTSTQNADATQLGHYSYTITRTWTATDACGNQSSQSQVITVQDTTVPVLSGQGPAQTIQCPASPVFTAPTATDNCDPNPQISFVDTTTPGACAGAYTVTRTWTAKDVSGNVSLPVSQTITVEDTTAPLLSGVPANVTVECSAVPPAASPTASDNCDPNPTVSLVETSTQNPDPSQLAHYSYTITRTWTATDACGNQSNQSQIITVHDTTLPVLAGQGPALTIQCPASPAFTAPTATDNCDPNPQISFVDTTSPGACAGNYAVTRTWTAKDVSGNVSLPVSQTITMEDITPPSLSGVPTNVTVECSAVPPAATPTATDNCDPNPKISFSQTSTQNADATQLGHYSYTINRTWTATDACGNQSSQSQVITVHDTTAPVLSGQGSAQTIQCPASPTFTAPTATDNCDPNPQISFTDTTTPGACAGAYTVTRTWTAKDVSGNVSLPVSQTITVEDTTAPVLSGVPANVTVECSAVPPPATPTATDNCDAAPKISFSQTSTQNADVTQLGHYSYTITRTWTATDACGNQSSQSQVITVHDTTAPVLSGQGLAQTIQCPASPVFTAPTATDNCDPNPKISFVDTTTPGACAGAYTVTRTWTAKDVSGNISLPVSQTITMEDITPPSLSGVPANVTVECSAVPPPATPTATDNCDPNPKISFSQTSTQNADATQLGHYSYTITRTWTATDACGNQSSQSQVITVHDTTAPVLSGQGPAQTIQCPASPVFMAPTSTDNCDPNPQISFVDTTTPGACAAAYTVTRTWTAKDVSGNASLPVSQTITVEDITAPVLSGVPANVTVECSAVPPPATPTATDNCDSNPKITFSQTSTQNADATQLGHYSYTITRTWTATDACGNQSSQSQVITVHDTTAPVLSGQGPAQTIQCPASPVFTAPTATDNCDPHPQMSFVDTTTPGACAGAYTVTRTWTAKDVSGNASLPVSQTITMEDITPPSLSGVPANVTVECSAVPPPATPTASDNCDPNPKITFSQTSTQNADATQLGHYSYTITRTWTATDACGNQSSQSQVITVHDTTAPVLSGQGPAKTIQCPVTPVFTAPTATDNCDPNPQISSTDTTTPGGCAGTYSITRTWTARDVSGNGSLPVSQTITVQDTNPPVITLPANVTIACTDSHDPNVDAVLGFATATDSCSQASKPTYSDQIIAGNCPGNYTIKRTWTSQDACGNVGTAVQTITVQDIVPPVVTPPANVTIACTDSQNPSVNPVLGVATAADNCSGASTPTFSDQIVPGNCAANYTINRTWSSHDGCGNVGTALQTITVRDTVKPTITIPPNVTVDCTADTSPASTGTATAQDVCTSVSVTYSDAVTNICVGSRIITRTWTATDGCGNSVSGVQTISALDRTPPTVSIVSPAICTSSQGGWGGGGSPGSLLPQYFTQVFPNGVTLGIYDPTNGNAAPNGLFWQPNSAGLAAFQSAVRVGSGTGGPITQDAVNPTSTYGAAGLGRQTLALTCNIAFNAAGLLGGTGTNFGSLIYTNSGDSLNGMTVSQILNVANQALAGQALPAGYDFSALNGLIDSLNISFESCTMSSWAASHLKSAVLVVQCPSEVPPPNLSLVTASGSCSSPVTITSLPDVITNYICPTRYTVLRTFLATDACGNSNTVSYFIIVSNSVPPTLTCPPNLVLECPANTSTNNTGVPIAYSVCGSVFVSYSDVVSNTCGGSEVIYRTWTATDGCNATTGLQTITVRDTTPPVVTAPANITIACTDSLNPSLNPVLGSATAVDSCSGTSTPTYSDQVVPGNCPGNYAVHRTWTSTDACGNTGTALQIITVQDIVPPVVTPPANITVACTDSLNPSINHVLGMATAVDNCSGASTPTFADQILAGNCAGNYTIRRTWSSHDGCGNVGTALQIITVQDTVAPVVTAPANVTIACTDSLNPSVNAALGMAAATDGCSGASAPTYSDHIIPGNCAGNYTVQRTWSSHDGCGNVGTAMQTIQVQDTTPPTIAAPPNLILPFTANIGTNQTGVATASDGCSGVTLSYHDTLTIKADGTQVITRTWTAIDGCGNSASAVQTITLDSPSALILPAQTNVLLTDLTTLTVINTATNPNVPANPIVYQLVNPPAGATIDAHGVITWTPTLSESPGTNLITTVVTTTVTSAAGTSTISSTNSFLVIIATAYDGLDLSVDTDGDGLTNLVEYAVGSDPRNSADGNSGIVVWIMEDSGNHYLAMKFKRRVNAAALQLQYVPEVSADKTNWLSDNANVLELSVTPFDSEFDWVTVRDITPITPAAARFIRLDVISATLESASPTWIGTATTLQGGAGTGYQFTTFAQRMVLPVLYAGTISSLQNTALTDTNATWTSGEFGSVASPAYAEFDNGWMVDIAGTTSTTKSMSLAGSLSGLVGPGDAYRVRQHFTVASLFGTNNETCLKPGLNPSQADNILLTIPQTQQTMTIFYFSNAVAQGWYRADYSPAADQVVYPEQGVMVRRIAQGNVNLYVCGPIKTGVTIAPVDTGFNLVGTLKSLSPMTLDTLNLYTGDPTTGIASGLNLTLGDNLLVVQASGKTASYFYYKNSKGQEGWLDSLFNPAGNTPIPAGSAFFIKRQPVNGPFNWTIPAE